MGLQIKNPKIIFSWKRILDIVNVYFMVHVSLHKNLLKFFKLFGEILINLLHRLKWKKT